MRVPIGLVFRRETRRSSRRVRSMALRVVLSALPMVLVVVTAMLLRTNDLSQSGGSGRQLFGWFSGLLVTFAVIVPPVAGAMGVHAEREEGTLDLLQLTNLNMRRVLDGIIAARLVGVVLALAGAAPALALLTTLGGVAPAEVAYLSGTVLAIAVYVGWFSAMLAAVMRGVVVPVVITWTALFVSFFGLCCVACVAGGALSVQSGGAPIPPEPISFVIGLLLLPVPGVLWTRWVAAAALTRSMYGAVADSDDVRWRMRVGVRRALALGLVVLAALSIPAGWGAALLNLGAWFWLFPLASASLCLASMQVSIVEIAAAIASVRVRAREMDPLLDWRQLPHTRALRWMRSGVVGNPVAWRELVTSGAGSMLPYWAVMLMSVAMLGLVIATTVASSALHTDGMGKVVAGALAGLCALGVIVGPLVLPFQASASWTPDRRSSTAALLMQTKLRSRRLVWGKLLAYAVRVHVSMGIASIVMLISAVLLESSTDVLSLMPQRVLGFVALHLWFLALAGMCHVIAARVRPTRMSWMVGSAVVVTVVGAGWTGLGLLGPYVAMLLPLTLLAKGVEFGVAQGLIACVLWGLLAIASWALLALRVETWMLNDRP